MQHASMYLYSNKIDVFINPENLALWETYHAVYTRNLKIYRSVDNTIELRIKNSDQRKANICDDIYLVFNLITNDSDKFILKKDCVFRDRATGVAFVTLTKEELYKIEIGAYQYSIVQERREFLESGGDEYTVNQTTPTYVDSNFSMMGVLEVVGNVHGETIPSTIIDKFSYVNPIGLGEIEPVFYESSIVDAAPHTTTPQSNHTFQFFLDSFEGDIVIQASTEEQGATPSKFTDVYTFTPTEDKFYINLVGKYSWFRLRYLPTKENEGKFIKALYR